MAPCAELLMREQSWCPGAAQRPPTVWLLIITCSLPVGLVSLAAHAAAHLQRLSCQLPAVRQTMAVVSGAGNSSSLWLGCCSWADKGIPGIFPRAWGALVSASCQPPPPQCS